MDDYGNQLQSDAIAHRFDKGIKRMGAIAAAKAAPAVAGAAAATYLKEYQKNEQST